jgi:hypothetical protein
MNHIVSVKEYTSAAEMMASYAAIKRKFRRARPPVVLQIEAQPDPQPIFISTTFDQARHQRELDRRMFEAFDDYERQQAAKAHCRSVIAKCEPTEIRIPAAFIIQCVAERHGVSVVDIKSLRRTRIVIAPRQEYCWLVGKMTELSYVQVGKTLSNRDHTTALHSVRKVQGRVDNDLEYAASLFEFMEFIRSSYVESLQ